MAKTTGTEPLTGVDLNSTTELTQKPDRGHLSLNLVQSNLTNLKNVNPSYSFHQSHLTSPATTPSPSSINHDTLYSANLSTSSLDTGLSSQEANSLKVSQNMGIVSGTTTADGNNFQQPVTFQKPQVLQTPYNNSMSAGSAKSVQQQYAYPQQPIIFTQPGAFAQTVQAPPMVIYNDQELLKLQQQQLQLQQQQLQQQQQQQQQPQPMVIPQQFNFVNQQQQLKQFQQFQQYQQAQLRQQQQQQQMAQRVQNPQFVFRQVPGGPASPQMPSPLSTTAQKPGQMFTSSPAASTSFQSTPLATTAAAIPTRQSNFRNQVPPGPRIRRSFSTSSPLSQTASSTVHKAPARSTQKGPYIHANIHFSNTDLSSAVMSPNSPTFQVNQIPSPSTTISEIETYDDIASLASPIVSPFMPNMPAIRFPTDSKRPNQDYSVDEVASNGDHDLIEPTKRQRSNTQGSQIVRRLSSTSETSVRPVGDVTSPKSISSSPCNSSRKPLTPAPSANSTNDTHIASTPSVPTIPATTSSSTVSAPTITTTTTMASNTTTKTLSTKKNAGRFNNTTIVRSPISGSFSTSTVSSAVAKKDNNKPTTSTFSVNIGSAGVSSFGSQGQQLVFPLNPVNGANQFENESIATLSGNASTSANHGKETSFSGRSRANAQNANNGMGRFEVLTFHQYEKPMTPEDRRLKQKQKQQKNDSKDKTLKARSSTQAAKKRVSMVKEENEDIEKSFKKEENKDPGSDNLKNGRENPSMALMDSSMTTVSTESTSSDSAPAETNTALTTTAASSGNSPLTIVPEIKSEPGVLAHDDIKPDNDVYMFDGDDTTIFTSSATVLDDEDFSNIMDYSFGGDHGTTGNLLMMHDPTIVDDNPVFLDDLTKYN